jgi:hypothetical protein
MGNFMQIKYRKRRVHFFTEKVMASNLTKCGFGLHFGQFYLENHLVTLQFTFIVLTTPRIVIVVVAMAAWYM